MITLVRTRRSLSAWPSLARLVALAVVLAGLAACESTPTADLYQERPVEQLYNDAMDLLAQRDYVPAAKAFDEVERQHPYSTWATKAQIMAAYAYYEDNKYDEAVVAIDRFIQLHPGHRDVAYAYYLKGLCHYEQITDVARDQKMTELATDALREVVTRFPNSEYARDARLKLDLTVDHLAGKEMDIGRFYMKQKNYLAAINRFKTVVTQFQTTTHIPESLHRLVECYTVLGLTDEAHNVAAVLGHNFPGSDWYLDSYRHVRGEDAAAAAEARASAAATGAPMPPGARSGGEEDGETDAGADREVDPADLPGGKGRGGGGWFGWLW